MNFLHQLLAKRGLVDTPRSLIVGPSTGPQTPFPLLMEEKIIRGYGRGSKELGIPTANLPVDNNQTPWIADIESGVYFGWASLRLPPTDANQPTIPPDPTSPSTNSEFSIYPMVMSIGYNPYYQNPVRSAEVHILHEFGADFYHVEMRLLIMGFIRLERTYSNQQELIDDIKMDGDVALRSLKRKAWSLKETGQGTWDGSWLVRGIGEKHDVGEGLDEDTRGE